jgi:PPOX class probable FMN-dependent enzyme
MGMSDTTDWCEQALTEPDQLRALYPPPHPVALAMQIDHLDQHCRDFIAASPFVLIGSTNIDGPGDVSPKGGPPGFVTVLDDHHLAVADLPGNYRLDGLTNIMRTPAMGTLFMIPGKGETLRVNGRGQVVRTDAVLDRCSIEGTRPIVAIVLEVREAFLHCSKAFVRSSLWKPDAWPDTSDLAAMSCMVHDHMEIAAKG